MGLVVDVFVVGRGVVLGSTLGGSFGCVRAGLGVAC